MYTRVESKFWQDEKMRDVSSDARHLMLYLLTSPHRNILGLYFLPVPYACFDLGWDEERLLKGLEELLRKGCIRYDKKNFVVFIVNFLNHNPLDNQNQVKGAINRLEQLPETPLIEDLYQVVEQISDEKAHYKPLLEQLTKLIPKPLQEGSGRVAQTPSKQEEVEVEEEVKEEVTVTVKELDKETVTEPVENKTAATATLYDDGFKFVVKSYKENIGLPAPVESERLLGWLEDMDPDVIVAAIEEAVLHKAPNMKYIEGILNNWFKENVKTKPALNAYQRKWQHKKAVDAGEIEAKPKARVYTDGEIEAAISYIKSQLKEYKGRDKIGFIRNLGYPDEVADRAINKLIERKELKV